MTKYEFVDFLKGLAIIGVIVLHAYDWTGALAKFFQISVPLFLYIMAFNFALSWERTPDLKQYFWRRAKRLLPAFSATWFGIVILALLLNVAMHFSYQQLVGFFPVIGMGNYFIVVIFQFVLFAPLLYMIFKRSLIGSLILFAIVYSSFIFLQYAWFTYPYNLLRFLPYIWIGFFLSKKKWLKKDFGIAPINWCGRHSYELFLLQIVFFSPVGILPNYGII